MADMTVGEWSGERLLEELKEYDSDVLRTTLSREDEDPLREAFGAACRTTTTIFDRMPTYDSRMRRRAWLSLATGCLGTLAGCSAPSDRTTTSDAGSRTPGTTESEPGTGTEGGPDTGTATPTATRSATRTRPRGTREGGVDTNVLVRLYTLAHEFHGQGEQQWADATAQFDAESYQQAATGFAAARQSYADSNTTLIEVTQRITDAGVGGFRIADDAASRTELMERAASNYEQACLSTLTGEQTTADSYRESAESFRLRATNLDFESPQAFESSLRSSL